MYKNEGEKMQTNTLIISCQKILTNSTETYQFLIEIRRIILKTEKKCILLDMSNTKIFETNLLVFYNLFIDEALNLNKEIIVLMPNNAKYKGSKILVMLFKYYAQDKRSFFKPRLIVGNKNVRETEDVLIKYLKGLNLEHYNTIKTLISELIANIKMHVQRVDETTRGYLSAAYSIEEGCMIVSIANNSHTIRSALKIKNYEFDSDINAIIWTLKKSNSTRDDGESGGIGLYLLRKYLQKLNAKATLVSGNCYLELNSMCYNSLGKYQIQSS